MLDLRDKRRAMGLFFFCLLLTEREVTKLVSHWLFSISKSVVAVVFYELFVIVYLLGICFWIACRNRYCSDRVAWANRYEDSEICYDPKPITTPMRRSWVYHNKTYSSLAILYMIGLHLQKPK